MSTVFSVIASSTRIPYLENLYFENLKYLIDSSITKAKLDFHDRSRPTKLNK